MAFSSQHAPKIWDHLHEVYVPDYLTRNPEEVRRFGVRLSGQKEVDAMMANNLILVKIPIIQILQHFDNGIDIQIPNRSTMLQIYQDIEDYLEEWKNHIRVDINSSASQHKALLVNLEKLSKRIYEKASAKELNPRAFSLKNFGLVNPLQMKLEEKQSDRKPDYAGISELLRPKVKRERF